MFSVTNPTPSMVGPPSPPPCGGEGKRERRFFFLTPERLETSFNWPPLLPLSSRGGEGFGTKHVQKAGLESLHPSGMQGYCGITRGIYASGPNSRAERPRPRAYKSSAQSPRRRACTCSLLWINAGTVEAPWLREG